MKVYVVFNDCPPDFGDISVISIHQSPIGAESRIRKLKGEDEYVNQYLTKQQFELEN